MRYVRGTWSLSLSWLPASPIRSAGVDSYFQAQQEDGSWHTTHVMFSPTGARTCPRTVPPTEVMAVQAIGLRGPVKVEIPDMTPGRYRIERRFVTGGRITALGTHLTTMSRWCPSQSFTLGLIGADALSLLVHAEVRAR